MHYFLRMSLVAVVIAAFSGCGSNTNNAPTEIDQDPQGFSIYRSGQPEAKDFKMLCDRGIRSVFALNGRGNEYIEAFQAACPGVTLVYNTAQHADSGIDGNFLTKFDDEVQKAKASGYGVLFHCDCGCHRTGRLAAYYRLKYNGWDANSAISEMNRIGKSMDEHPSLPAQVRAYVSYLNGTACKENSSACVQ